MAPCSVTFVRYDLPIGVDAGGSRCREIRKQGDQISFHEEINMMANGVRVVDAAHGTRAAVETNFLQTLNFAA